MRLGNAVPYLIGLMVAVGMGVSFVLLTVLMADVSDEALVALPLLLVAVTALALGGTKPTLRQLREDRAAAVYAALGGVMAFWAAPLLVLLQRATDAPSGSETLFFTTSAWGLIVALTGYAVARSRHWPTLAAAAVAGTAGAAGLLANWERPSSFSPFVKFPTQEMLMLVAGLLFAVGSVAVAHAMRRGGFKSTAVISLVSAAIVAAPVGLLGGDSPITLNRLWPSLLLLGVVQSVVTLGWLVLLEKNGAARSSWALFLAPAAVTSFAVVERLTGVWGADPIQWPAATASMIVMLAAAVVIAVSGRSAGVADARSESRLGAAALYTAIAALLGSAVSLGLPALQAASRGAGITAERFQADWVMVGAESAVGWFVFASALLVVSAIFSARSGAPRYTTILASVAAVLTAGAFLYVGETSFYTHTRWIPAEVQQTYGTEYARFWVEPIFEPVRSASAVLVTVAAVLSIVNEFRPRSAYVRSARKVS